MTRVTLLLSGAMALTLVTSASAQVTAGGAANIGVPVSATTGGVEAATVSVGSGDGASAGSTASRGNATVPGTTPGTHIGSTPTSGPTGTGGAAGGPALGNR